MESDPDKINDADRALQQSIYKRGEFYAASNKRQKAENDLRTQNRKEIKALGIRPDAYATAVKLIRSMSEGERADFMRDLKIVMDVLGARQAELFPEETIKQAKKAEQDRVAKLEAAQTAKDQAERDKPGSRSDPASGGAGKKKGGKGKADNVVGLDGKAVEQPPNPPEEKQETGDELIASVSKEEQAKQEQREGAAILDTAGKPKSQSQISAEKLEAANLNR